MGWAPSQGDSGGTLGTTVEVAELESLADGAIIIGDGVGAPTTLQAYSSSAGTTLYLGGTTSAFPAWKRVTTSLRARLADDSAYTNIYSASGFHYANETDLVIAVDTGEGVQMVLGRGLYWSSSATIANTDKDTGIKRNAAGVLEVNNGTAGTFRDIRCRNVAAASTVTTDATVTNTGTETSVYSFTVPANALSTNILYLTTLLCKITTDAVTAGNIIIRAKYSTAVATSETITLGTGLSNVPVLIEFYLASDGATNAQLLMLKVTGLGIGSAGGDEMSVSRAVGAIDSTAAQTLDVTADFSVADLDNTFVMEYGTTEKTGGAGG